ncbi:RNA-binding S4 domain-containing protein [Enterovibrio nigricans]|uniref:Ribosome-associated protein n=1 Tax=Enterovibrio nigricans DSM 22720 TaxID=1121868 RepID=A0A1T4VPC7_9GAMM|nr:RNA-binding S4 domain-containing protein [Enterovibrio nigricans]SKA66824.1 ribosome-associated protein [Enterovibrio nigricans DSM 22720]
MSHEEFEVEALGIEVSSQPIELYKVLKIANAVSGGGEAKAAISEGYVVVNGEVENRKRRKVYDGDVIAFNEEFYVVLCDTPPVHVEPKPKAPKAPKATEAPKETAKLAKEKSPKNAKEKKKAKPSNPPTQVVKKDVEETPRSSSGRRVISF